MAAEKSGVIAQARCVRLKRRITRPLYSAAKLLPPVASIREQQRRAFDGDGGEFAAEELMAVTLPLMVMAVNLRRKSA